MYKAIFIDVDGTLIRKDHSISNETFDIIQKLKEKNILVVLVSARPFSGMEPIAAKIGLLDYPLASLNGAYISYGGNIIFESAINADIANKLHEQVQSYNPTIIYYQQDKWFSQLKNYNTDYEQRITSIPIIIQPFGDTLLSWQKTNTGPNKILMIADELVINEMHRHLKNDFHGQVNVSTSKPTYLELMDKNASKLQAIKFLMNHFNIKKEEVIAIGDNYNDKEMIEFAGMGVAMGNAPEDVKSVADFITDTNNNNGVSKAINSLIDF